MTPLALLLVLVSAGAHAYWNFLLKRAGGTRPFIALSKASEAVLFLPVFLLTVRELPAGALADVAPYAAVATALTLASYAALAAAYRLGDLSFAYPIARGGTLLFLPVLGGLVFGERVGAVGWTAIAAIVGGVLVMQLPRLAWGELRTLGARLRGAPTLVALGMALLLATGVVWDAFAVRRVPVAAYFYAYTAATGAVALLAAWRADGAAALAATWRAHRLDVVLVAVLAAVSYGLVLLALRTGAPTYVVGLRQLSIVGGVWLGARWLGEAVSTPRRAGVALLVAGCVLMAAGR